jgi:MFS family permease
MVSILAGLRSAPDRRGRVFGLLGLTNGAGSVVGGLAVGALVENLGYPAMFSALALTLLLWVLAAARVDDRPPVPRGGAPATAGGPQFGVAAWAVFLAVLLMAAAAFAGMLGRSLLMDQLGFAAAAIAGTTAVAGAVSLPVPLTGGWLSDRLGRAPLLVAGALLGALGLALLATAAALWQILVAMGLVAIMMTSGIAVGLALVADLVPEAGQGRAMALLNAATWVGAIVGFGAFGIAAAGIGLAPALLASASLPLLAAAVLATPMVAGATGGHWLPSRAGTRPQ